MGSKGVDRAGDEREANVEQIHANAAPQLSEEEIAQTFETLGLDSQEKRDAILEQRHWVGEQRHSEAHYVIVSSNNSQPVPVMR